LYVAKKSPPLNHFQRQAEGIAAARARGVVFGRKAVEVPDDFPEIYRQWRNGRLTGKQAAKLCGFSVKTLYNLTAGWRAQG
jgi:DNA invertase Pin-like site-specific DNA recombinase